MDTEGLAVLRHRRAGKLDLLDEEFANGDGAGGRIAQCQKSHKGQVRCRHGGDWCGDLRGRGELGGRTKRDVGGIRPRQNLGSGIPQYLGFEVEVESTACNRRERRTGCAQQVVASDGRGSTLAEADNQ